MKLFRILLLLVFILSSFSLFSQGEEKTKEEIKLERKNKRIAKRYVYPKSMFFQLSSGLTLSKTRFSHKDMFIYRNNYNLDAYSYFVKVEVGTKDNYFHEIGVSFR